MFVVRACLQYELIEALFLQVFSPVPIWKLSPTLLEGEGEGGRGEGVGHRLLELSNVTPLKYNVSLVTCRILGFYCPKAAFQTWKCFQNCILKQYGIDILHRDTTRRSPSTGSLLENCADRQFLFQLPGTWDMRGKQLFHGIEIKNWAIVCFANPQDCNERALRHFSNQLMKISGETGMPIRSGPCFCRYARRADEVSNQIPLFLFVCLSVCLFVSFPSFVITCMC